MFQIRSKINDDAQKLLLPKLELRSWDNLSSDEKDKIWHYLKGWFFNDSGEVDINNGYLRESVNLSIISSIHLLNDKNKYQSYGKKTLKTGTWASVIADFYNIFMNEKQHVVLEMLSYYCETLIEKRRGQAPIQRKEQTDEDYALELCKRKHEYFDRFADGLNDILDQFYINISLTRLGFVPKQDNKVLEEIYNPVLICLSGNNEFLEINRELGDSFSAYQKQDYSGCITHLINSLEGYLQITINGKIGQGLFNDLLNKAITRNLIPNDSFNIKIFSSIESIFAKERMHVGNAHIKKEYATPENARLLLNLGMVFLQHCIVRI